MTKKHKHKSSVPNRLSDDPMPSKANDSGISATAFLLFKKHLNGKYSLLREHTNIERLLEFPPDDHRVLVRHPEASEPYRHICYINANFGGDGEFTGTGWLAGPRLIVTAAHVVRQPECTLRSLTITRAYDGDNHGRYKPITISSDALARSLHVPANYQHENSADDYAAIILQSSQPDGYLRFAVLDDETLNSHTFHVGGYPDQFTSTDGIVYSKRQCEHSGIIQQCTNSFIKYHIDTTSGQSGGPVWIDHGENQVVVGIHVGEDNRAVRINQKVYDFINRIQPKN